MNKKRRTDWLCRWSLHKPTLTGRDGTRQRGKKRNQKWIESGPRLKSIQGIITICNVQTGGLVVMTGWIQMGVHGVCVFFF